MEIDSLSALRDKNAIEVRNIGADLAKLDSPEDYDNEYNVRTANNADIYYAQAMELLRS